MRTNKQMGHEEIINSLKLHDPYFEVAKINKAIELTLRYNKYQEKAKEFYYNPLEIAEIVLKMNLDTNSVIAALLHNVVEDNNLTLETVDKTFGQEVAKLIKGINKLSKIEFFQNNINQVENFRKLLLALSTDIRIILIKLADRLHYMRIINFVESPGLQRQIAIETMEIYATLAERMGIHQIKSELQDICFKIIHPDISESILNHLRMFPEFNNKDLINSTINELQHKINNIGITPEIHGRCKTPYSIWMKMQRKNISVDQLSDIIAVRIIVKNIPDCYRVLGVIHTTYKMMPESFHDFISIPKDNGYQSLHTVVTLPINHNIEIQIRTQEMHTSSELGVAAHWRYKQKNNDLRDHNYYKWINEIVIGLDKSGNLNNFLQNTKLEMYYDQVFCFTPKGNLVVLPKGATAIDFAYAVHSNIGNHCVGVKINDHIAPLKSVLKNGEQVEIITSKNQIPSPTWEKFVVTAKARYEIRKYLRINKKRQYIKLGQTIIDGIFKEANITEANQALNSACSFFEKENHDELFYTIGEGTLKRKEIIAYFIPQKNLIKTALSLLKFKQTNNSIRKEHSNDNKNPQEHHL